MSTTRQAAGALAVGPMLDHQVMAPARAKRSKVPRTRAEAVAAELRDLIRAGAYVPGDRLRQVELAERFDVSTTPLREALLALVQEGLVTQDPNRGFVVFEPSPDDLAEIYAIRVPLEVMAIEAAAVKLTPVELDELDRILVEMRDVDPQRYVELNHEFHSRIYAAAGMPRLNRMIDMLRAEASHYLSMNVSQYDANYRQETQAEHEGILQILRSGTPKQAGRALRQHLEHHAAHTAALIQATHAPRRD